MKKGKHGYLLKFNGLFNEHLTFYGKILDSLKPFFIFPHNVSVFLSHWCGQGQPSSWTGCMVPYLRGMYAYNIDGHKSCFSSLGFSFITPIAPSSLLKVFLVLKIFYFLII